MCQNSPWSPCHAVCLSIVLATLLIKSLTPKEICLNVCFQPLAWSLSLPLLSNLSFSFVLFLCVWDRSCFVAQAALELLFLLMTEFWVPFSSHVCFRRCIAALLTASFLVSERIESMCWMNFMAPSLTPCCTFWSSSLPQHSITLTDSLFCWKPYYLDTTRSVHL